jgi:HD-like signal output (HDOD) protein
MYCDRALRGIRTMEIKITPPASGQTQHQDIESRIGAELRDIGIPPRPTILARIETEMRKDEPDFKLLADIISSDMGLAASVIKVSNSAYFGVGRRVRTILEALLILGLKLTVTTIAGIALQRAFPNVPNLDRFWEASSRMARVSGWLAQRLKGRVGFRSEDAYTFGLFRDCGMPVLMIPFPEYRQILHAAESDHERLFTAIEDEQLSINHAIVGAELAEDWMLPADICEGIRYHHYGPAINGDVAGIIPPNASHFIALTMVAQHLIQRYTDLYPDQEWHKLGSASLSLLQIQPKELAELATDAEEVVNATL